MFRGQPCEGHGEDVGTGPRLASTEVAQLMFTKPHGVRTSWATVARPFVMYLKTIRYSYPFVASRFWGSTIMALIVPC